MRTLLALGAIAVGIASIAVPAQAQQYPGYPAWAQKAFEPKTGK